MKVHLNQVPDEGLHIEGDEPAEILDLHDPLLKPVSPVHFALDVGRSGTGMFATGTLSVDLEAQCVACLRTFRYPVRVADFAAQMELGGPETVDLTPQAREDILLALPAHPHCDWNGEEVCKGALPRRQEESPHEAAKPQAWDQLDKLKLKSK